MKYIKTKQDIFNYLGIEPTIYETQEEKKLLKEIIQEFKDLRKKYTDFESCFIDDLDIYIKYSEIIYKGKYLAVFKGVELWHILSLDTETRT